MPIPKVIPPKCRLRHFGGIMFYVLSLAECQSFYMVVDVDVSHVGSLVPSWFAGHIIRYEFAVDSKVLEANVLHHTALVVTCYYTHIGSRATIGNVAQHNVLNATSGG